MENQAINIWVFENRGTIPGSNIDVYKGQNNLGYNFRIKTENFIACKELNSLAPTMVLGTSGKYGLQSPYMDTMLVFCERSVEKLA